MASSCPYEVIRAMTLVQSSGPGTVLDTRMPRLRDWPEVTSQ